FVRVIVVLRLLCHSERARHGYLDEPLRVGAQEFYIFHLDRMLAPDRRMNARHRIRVTGTVHGCAWFVDINSVERGCETVRVTLAPDLAIGNDVQSRFFLRADRD